MMGSSSCTLIPASVIALVLLPHGLRHGGRLFLRAFVVFARQEYSHRSRRCHESLFHILASESGLQIPDVALNQLVSRVSDRSDIDRETEADALRGRHRPLAIW